MASNLNKTHVLSNAGVRIEYVNVFCRNRSVYVVVTVYLFSHFNELGGSINQGLTSRPKTLYKDNSGEEKH